MSCLTSDVYPEPRTKREETKKHREPLRRDASETMSSRATSARKATWFMVVVAFEDKDRG